MPDIDLSTVISGGGFAVFTAFMWYLVTKFLPSIIASFREEINNQRATQEKTSIILAEAIKEQGHEIVRALAALEAVNRDSSKEIIAALNKLELATNKFSEMLIKLDMMELIKRETDKEKLEEKT